MSGVHISPFAYREAREHGIRVDESMARADAATAYFSLSKLERAEEYNYQIDPIEDAARLIGAEAAGVRPTASSNVDDPGLMYNRPSRRFEDGSVSRNFNRERSSGIHF